MRDGGRSKSKNRSSSEERMEDDERTKRASTEDAEKMRKAKKKAKLQEAEQEFFNEPDYIDFQDFNKKAVTRKLCTQEKFKECEITNYKGAMTDKDANKLLDYLNKEILPTMKVQKTTGLRTENARKIKWYGPQYTYSNTTLETNEDWDPIIEETKEWVQNTFNVTFNSCLINYYKAGNVGIGAHSDDEPELGDQPFIVSLSLGTSRTMIFRDKDNRSMAERVVLTHGSILTMAGRTQELLTHEIPAEQTAHTPRYNLTFRFTKPRVEFFEGGQQSESRNEEQEQGHDQEQTVWQDAEDRQEMSPQQQTANRQAENRQGDMEEGEIGTQAAHNRSNNSGVTVVETQQHREEAQREDQPRQQTQQGQTAQQQTNNRSQGINNRIAPIIFETQLKDPISFQRWLQKNFPGTRIQSVRDLRYASGYIVYPFSYEGHQELLHTPLKYETTEGHAVHRRLPKTRPVDRRDNNYANQQQHHSQANGQPSTPTTHTFIMTGVNSYIDTAKLTGDLQNLGYPIKAMARITSAATGTSTPLVRVFTEDSNFVDTCITGGLKVGYQVFRCEHSRNSQPIYVQQCYNCQMFGHHQRDCDAPVCCKTCGRAHDSRSCPDRDEVNCRNCGGNHPASFKGCVVRINEIKRKARETAANDRQQVISYAAAVGGLRGGGVAGIPKAASTTAKQHWEQIRGQNQQIRHTPGWQGREDRHNKHMDYQQQGHFRATGPPNTQDMTHRQQQHQTRQHTQAQHQDTRDSRAGRQHAQDLRTPSRRVNDAATLTSPPLTVPIPPSTLVYIVACTLVQVSAVLGKPLSPEQTCQMAAQIVGGVTGAMPQDMSRLTDGIREFGDAIRS